MSGIDQAPVARTQGNIALAEDPIEFSSMTSACPTPGFTAADRGDPFFHGMWGDGSQASWLSRRLMERLHAERLVNLRRGDLDRTVEQAVAELTRRGNRQRHSARMRATRLASLAVAGMWRTVSSEQLAAFTGTSVSANRATMLPAFQAGLVDRGTLLSELPISYRGRVNHLYRPMETPAFERLLEHVSFAEWQALTAGMGWTRGPQHDRHNILSAELGLRVAEYLDVGAVLGESTSRLDLLADRPVSADNRRADMTIVRPDGHRIAVELTSSVGGGLQRKASRWAETLNSADPAVTGLSVVFVDAAVPDRTERLRRDVWTSMRATVGRAAYSIPGALRNQVPDRMAVARWQWWFPRARSCAPAFLSLQAERPTGPHTARWEQVHLLDQFDLEFAPDDPAAGQSLLSNARGLWGAPSWLRQDSPPDLSQLLLDRVGLADPIRLPSAGQYAIAGHRSGDHGSGFDDDDWLSEL